MSGEVSSVQRSVSQKWVEAGIWVDVVFVSMVLVSIAGLAYEFLAH